MVVVGKVVWWWVDVSGVVVWRCGVVVGCGEDGLDWVWLLGGQGDLRFWLGTAIGTFMKVSTACGVQGSRDAAD